MVRVIYSPTHLLHDPSFEVAGGVRIPAWEVTGRAEAIRAALAADPAFEVAGPVAHGLDPILAVHDPGLVGFLESAWPVTSQAGIRTPPATSNDGSWRRWVGE